MKEINVFFGKFSSSLGFNVKFILMAGKRPTNFQQPLNWRRIYHQQSLLCWLGLCVSADRDGATWESKDGRECSKDLSKWRDRGREIYDGNYRLRWKESVFARMKRYWNEEFISLIARGSLFYDLHFLPSHISLSLSLLLFFYLIIFKKELSRWREERLNNLNCTIKASSHEKANFLSLNTLPGLLCHRPSNDFPSITQHLFWASSSAHLVRPSN